MRKFVLAAALLTMVMPVHAGQTPYSPPRHTAPPPIAFSRAAPYELAMQADGGTQVERDRPATHALAEHRRLSRALANLLPQRKGVVDAYVLTVGLDSDPVFGRESREATKVLARRFDAVGRSITLGGSDGSAPSALPMGSPANLEAAIARIAEVMDPAEDVLVLYTTSHGLKHGIVYNDGNEGYGIISPRRLADLLRTHRIQRRLLMISACYSGVFVPELASPQTAIVTAASHERTSFGCMADNDWTFFGDAVINNALRKPVTLATAVREGIASIEGWESSAGLIPSMPQVVIGADVPRWLTPLEARMPKVATQPVGRASLASLNRPRF